MDTAASMTREQVELPDGRYLIYYTFGAVEPGRVLEMGEPPAPAAGDDQEQHGGESQRDV